jgi:1,4-dihydroxy-2-naphthoyl-CoA hydrolase
VTDSPVAPESVAPQSVAPQTVAGEPGRSEPPGSGPDGLARVRAMGPGTLIERMGIEFVEASAQRLVATMPVAGNTQPMGLLHGGASCVLAETLGSVGATLHGAGQGLVAVGLDLNATHHRSTRSGLVTGTATALHLGGSVASYGIEVTDETGRRLCTARLTCLLRRPPQ